MFNVPGIGSINLSFLVSANDFTVSELCIHIHEKDQPDAHLFSLIYSD